MNTSTVVTIIIVAVILALVSPILFIWSLNTLFGLNIAYGFLEWLSALLLVSMVTGNGIKYKAKD